MDLEKIPSLIKDKTVFILGLGGLGGYVAELLARAGIGTILAADGDVFTESNLNRQILSTKDNLGKSKARAAAIRVRSISDTVIKAKKVYVTSENIAKLAKGADVLIDCCDNVESRLMLEKYADAQGLYIVHGAVNGGIGEVAVISPKSKKLSGLYKKQKNLKAGYTPSPAPAYIASLQAIETIKFLTERGEGFIDRMVAVDLVNARIRVFKL